MVIPTAKTTQVLEPQAQEYLERITSYGVTPLNRLTPKKARQAHVASSSWVSPHRERVADVENLAIDAGDRSIQARFYVPTNQVRSGTLVYFHGGGWVVGDLDTIDPVCRLISERCHMAVLSVDYRLAPEHRYPAALEDCMRVLAWAASGEGQPSSMEAAPLLVAGDSSGGNLAAACALKARSRSDLTIAAQVLIYPITDATMSSQSYKSFGSGYQLTASDMAWFWHMYLDYLPDVLDGEFSPLHATSLENLPPALVITAGCDPLRDEGEAYGRYLIEAGNYAQVIRFDGMLHGFVRCTGLIDRAYDAVEAIDCFLSDIDVSARL